MNPSNVNHSQSIDACTIEFLSSLKCFSRSPNSGLCYVSINSGLCQGLFRRLQKTLGALTAAFVMTGYTEPVPILVYDSTQSSFLLRVHLLWIR